MRHVNLLAHGNMIGYMNRTREMLQVYIRPD